MDPRNWYNPQPPVELVATTNEEPQLEPLPSMPSPTQEAPQVLTGGVIYNAHLPGPDPTGDPDGDPDPDPTRDPDGDDPDPEPVQVQSGGNPFWPDAKTFANIARKALNRTNELYKQTTGQWVNYHMQNHDDMLKRYNGDQAKIYQDYKAGKLQIRKPVSQLSPEEAYGFGLVPFSEAPRVHNDFFHNEIVTGVRNHINRVADAGLAKLNAIGDAYNLQLAKTKLAAEQGMSQMKLDLAQAIEGNYALQDQAGDAIIKGSAVAGIGTAEGVKGFSSDFIDFTAPASNYSASVGVDPNSQAMQMGRMAAYGAGTVGSFAVPGGGALRGASALNKVRVVGNAVNKINKGYHAVPGAVRSTVENATMDAAKGFMYPDGGNGDFTSRLNQAETSFSNSIQSQFTPTGFLQSTLGMRAGKAVSARHHAPSGHKDLGKMTDNIPGHPQSAQDIYDKGLQGPPPKELYGKSYKVNIPKTVEVNGRKVELPPYTREGVTRNGTKYVMGKKVVDQAYKDKENRGWYPELIQKVIDYPMEKRPHKRDVRRPPGQPKGSRVDQGTATDYVAPDGHYITINDQTGEIIGVSDRFNPDWIDAYTKKPLTAPKMDPKLEQHWRNYKK